MLTDTHCHLYSEYYSDIDSIIKESESKQVSRFINNGVSDITNKEVIKLINNYSGMYGALGIHPEEVLEYKPEHLEYIEKKLSNSKVIAVGEIGLDYHYGKENKEEQIELFEKQLAIAERNQLPVIVHSREATEDTINILKKYHVKGTIHSFSGSLETAKIYIKMGYLLGINGVVTFKNCNLKDILPAIGLNNIILETDSPYLTPVPDRGKTNNPGYVYVIAEYISNILNVDINTVINTTNENIKRMYHI